MASQPLRTGNEGVTPIEYYSSDTHYAQATRIRRPLTTGDFTCGCENCRRRERPPEWPRHYVGTPARFKYFRDRDRDNLAGEAWQSYECHVEGREIDPELEEELNALRNEPDRVGGLIVERRRAA